jgi:hypothetical protein
MTSERDRTTLLWMVELPVASSHANLAPPVGFEQPDHIPDFHAAIPLQRHCAEQDRRNDEDSRAWSRAKRLLFADHLGRDCVHRRQ